MMMFTGLLQMIKNIQKQRQNLALTFLPVLELPGVINKVALLN